MSVSATLLRRLALASLVGNVTIVLTGGAVRLTDSGLGCPTWPQCSDTSWTATGEMGIHGVIENGNRGLGVVLGAIALAGFLAALGQRPRRRSLVWLSGTVLAGVAAQGAIGGITVWTDLNPWIVAGHFLISMALVATAYLFWRRVDEPDAPVRPTVPAPIRGLTWLIVVAAGGLVVVGTIVTGSGPHAGDADVSRTGLDPRALSQAHADLAFLLLGLAVASWFALRAVRADPPANRAATLLIGTILAQGTIGLIQYAAGLPELAVWLHLLGASLVWLAAVHLLHTTGTRHPIPAPAPAPAAGRDRAAVGQQAPRSVQTSFVPGA